MDEGITVIVPAYNEAENIGETLKALKSLEGIAEIIAVDDGSTDNTLNIMKSIEQITVVSYKKNQGKGFAIKSALPYVSNKYVLMVDADLRESAAEMRKLVQHNSKGINNMLVAVYPKPLKKGGFGLVKQLSRKSLYMLTARSSDSVLSGQRMASTDFIKQIKLPDDFGIEFKMTLEALRHDINIIDVPLNIRHRETGRNLKGFIHRGKQFINILKAVTREMI